MYKLKNRIRSILSVIRRRYSLLEVPWRRIHDAIATAMSICVAYGNKVVDTRDWHSQQGVPPKYDFDSGMQCGRSMIEMLGVLAIIAVLSVGGIAGYSKAMQKWKITNIINSYTDLILGLLEYRQNFQDNIKGEPNLENYILSLNIVPKTWKMNEYQYLQDNYGNWLHIRYRQTNNIFPAALKEGIIIDFALGGINVDQQGKKSSDNFNERLCFDMFRIVLQPLHSTLNIVGLHGGNASYQGDKFCTGYNCLKDMTLNQMKSLCDSCNRQNICSITIAF